LNKVKLVAIAKNEAAYLPDWIFHHLYFGFDEIEIHINRTSDNSAEVLDQIIKRYPQVSYHYADWVDLCPHNVCRTLQLTVYSKAYDDTVRSGKYTHILFMDIDEFWTPQHLDLSINECLLSLPKHSSVSFNWYKILAEEKPFDYIAKEYNYSPMALVKTVLNLQTPLKKMRLHLPEFVENSFAGSIMSDGKIFPHAPGHRQRLLKGEHFVARPFFILHRMYRSEIEYISLLGRGNPESTDTFKFNRRGGFVRTTRNQRSLIFPDANYQLYSNKREEFFSTIKIEAELKVAQQFVLDNFAVTTSLLKNADAKYNDEIQNIFSGIENITIVKLLNEINEQSL